MTKKSRNSFILNFKNQNLFKNASTIFDKWLSNPLKPIFHCFRDKYKNDYGELKKRLKTLPDKVRYDVMVCDAFYKDSILVYQ